MSEPLFIPEVPNPFTAGKRVADGVDPDAYHRQDAKRGDKSFVMSRSELVKFDSCPSRWINGYEPKDSEATEFGSLLDTFIIDSGRFKSKYVVTPLTCTATKTCKAVKDGEANPGDQIPWSPTLTECKDWKADQQSKGLEVIDAEEQQACFDAQSRLQMDERISHYLSVSKKQVFLVAEYNDEATGLVIPCKSLIDLEPDHADPTYGKSLADYKTARNAGHRAWVKAVREHSYDVQAAMFSDMHFAATGEDRGTWYHVIQENVFPWQPARRLLSAYFVSIGRLIYTSALRKYAQCLATGVWPGYDDNAQAETDNGWSVCMPEPYMMDRI